MNKIELKEFLEAKVEEYNHPRFIETDPIQIPHQFSKKEDIEIAGFLTATISWGNRKSIITNANKMMTLLNQSPFDYVMNHEASDLEKLRPFVHRTFNEDDLIQFIKSLNHIYKNHGGLEAVFSKYSEEFSTQNAIHQFKKHFFEIEHLTRTQKHVSDPSKNSAAKRINMFLRWMVRSAEGGVDFGLWKKLNPAQLCVPLDLHVGRVARELGLLNRRQDDWKAVEELTAKLRTFDENDPIKYDFALFGMGRYEKFKL